mmetsp:Transcript_421/g.1007  ORF Transcript_421/g.1007 Transcript_421/m.1007 type:complete len:490 (-) Transcript_421:12233-13702(-)
MSQQARGTTRSRRGAKVQGKRSVHSRREHIRCESDELHLVDGALLPPLHQVASDGGSTISILSGVGGPGNLHLSNRRILSGGVRERHRCGGIGLSRWGSGRQRSRGGACTIHIVNRHADPVGSSGVKARNFVHSWSVVVENNKGVIRDVSTAIRGRVERLRFVPLNEHLVQGAATIADGRRNKQLQVLLARHRNQDLVRCAGRLVRGHRGGSLTPTSVIRNIASGINLLHGDRVASSNTHIVAHIRREVVDEVAVGRQRLQSAALNLTLTKSGSGTSSVVAKCIAEKLISVPVDSVTGNVTTVSTCRGQEEGFNFRTRQNLKNQRRRSSGDLLRRLGNEFSVVAVTTLVVSAKTGVVLSPSSEAADVRAVSAVIAADRHGRVKRNQSMLGALHGHNRVGVHLQESNSPLVSASKSEHLSGSAVLSAVRSGHRRVSGKSEGQLSVTAAEGIGDREPFASNVDKLSSRNILEIAAVTNTRSVLESRRHLHE